MRLHLTNEYFLPMVQLDIVFEIELVEECLMLSSQQHVKMTTLNTLQQAQFQTQCQVEPLEENTHL